MDQCIKRIKGAEAISILVSSEKAFQRCYQLVNEVLCYTIVPKCDPIKKQVIHPCKEMCEDIKDGCMATANSFLQKASSIIGPFLNDWKLAAKRHPSTWLNCDYLPAKGSVPCFYKPVTCHPPPNVTNAFIVNMLDFNDTYVATSQAEYSCQNKEFQMNGNSTVTCLYSGQWSDLPTCVRIPDSGLHPLVIVIPLLIFPVAVLAAISYFKISTFAFRHRDKEFDAFVCYKFDSDREFAEETILNQLQNKNPQFKLLLHNRDFTPGIHIKQNINEAVRNSNSAIIVMSQDFVNSNWCKEEFAECYIENMKDPAFCLFVIMMEPAETLKGASEYMKSFLDRNTYLRSDDPKLFQKIARYLTWVRKPKHGSKVKRKLIRRRKRKYRIVEI